MTLLLILEFIAPQPTGISALSFFDFDWLTWLMLRVLNKSSWDNNHYYVLFRKKVVTQWLLPQFDSGLIIVAMWVSQNQRKKRTLLSEPSAQQLRVVVFLWTYLIVLHDDLFFQNSFVKKSVEKYVAIYTWTSNSN